MSKPSGVGPLVGGGACTGPGPRPRPVPPPCAHTLCLVTLARLQGTFVPQQKAALPFTAGGQAKLNQSRCALFGCIPVPQDQDHVTYNGTVLLNHAR